MSDTSTPFVTDDADLAIRHFSAQVTALLPEQLLGWHGHADLIRHNVDRNANEMAPYWERVRSALPELAADRLIEMPTLALALEVVAGRVFEPASDGEIQRRLGELRPLREQMLMQLEIFSQRGLVPADVVEQIRRGRGPRDHAKDAIDIAAMFRDHAAALANKHPFIEAEINRVAVTGSWLLTQLTPRGARAEMPETSADALLRNRLWTELDQRHGDLWRAGALIWGRRVDEHILPLRSRVATPAREAPTQPQPAMASHAA